MITSFNDTDFIVATGDPYGMITFTEIFNVNPLWQWRVSDPAAIPLEGFLVFDELKSKFTAGVLKILQ
jgi:hypothetical protein